MLWVALFVGVFIISLCLESGSGKLVLALGVLAIGLALLALLFDLSLLMALAKTCVAFIIIVIVGAILLAIIGS